MRVDRDGQVVIPPEIQEQSGIYPGDTVDVGYENGVIVVRRGETSSRVREFLDDLVQVRREYLEDRRLNTGSMFGLEGLSRGEQFVRLLAGAGTGRMTTEEIMELTRGPYDDLNAG